MLVDDQLIPKRQHATALSATEAESCSNSRQESGLVNFVNNLFREEQLIVGEAAVK
jgi:hypothetical protein